MIEPAIKLVGALTAPALSPGSYEVRVPDNPGSRVPPVAPTGDQPLRQETSAVQRIGVAAPRCISISGAHGRTQTAFTTWTSVPRSPCVRHLSAQDPDRCRSGRSSPPDRNIPYPTGNRNQPDRLYRPCLGTLGTSYRSLDADFWPFQKPPNLAFQSHGCD